MIKSGDRLPSASVKFITEHETENADAASALGTGKVVMFTLPGAFTPTCSASHLPEFVALSDRIKACGVQSIVCATVNDHHVTRAWAEASGALGKVEFIADGNAEFAKALGLDKDLSAGGMGTRFIRAAIIIDNGVVDAVYIESAPGVVTTSGAPAIVEILES